MSRTYHRIMDSATALLAPLRRELDAIDTELIDVLGRRLALCARVARVKRENGIPMMQSGRVQHVIERGRKLAAAKGLSPEFVAALYQAIIGEACRLEDEIIEQESVG